MTDKISFAPEKDVPPRIVDAPDPPGKRVIESMFWINTSDPINARGDWPMRVWVVEENLTEQLTAHWQLISPASEDSGYRTLPIPPQGQLTRTFDFRVGTDLLKQHKCHRLELAVSSHFTERGFDDVDKGFQYQVAYAGWWVLEGEGDVDAGDIIASCGVIPPETVSMTTTGM